MKYIVGDLETRKKLASAGATWGRIIPAEGTDKERTAQKFKEIVEGLQPAKLILVGDVITDTCNRVGLPADLAIVDGKTHRGNYMGSQGEFGDFESVENPAGEIWQDAWDLIIQTINAEKTCLISVNGEEDLLAIPAILEAPLSSIIAFGQPPVTDADPPLPEGIAYITITQAIKNQVREIVDSLKTVE